MNRFRSFMYKFLYGRYGIDELYKFCMVIYFILIVLDLFINSNILTVLELVMFIIIMYRSLSRNKYRRKIENDKFLKIKKSLVKKYSNIKKRFNDRNTHMYKRCSKCKTTLRLPLKKGVHTVKCPKCSHKFTVKCNRNEKIKVEVIR